MTNTLAPKAPYAERLARAQENMIRATDQLQAADEYYSEQKADVARACVKVARAGLELALRELEEVEADWE